MVFVMKKLVSILTVFTGVVLFILNTYTINTTLLENPSKAFQSGEEFLKSKAEENTLEVSKVVLPTIFDALIKSLKS
jgi:hypothetical protein